MLLILTAADRARLERKLCDNDFLPLPVVYAPFLAPLFPALSCNPSAFPCSTPKSIQTQPHTRALYCQGAWSLQALPLWFTNAFLCTGILNSEFAPGENYFSSKVKSMRLLCVN